MSHTPSVHVFPAWSTSNKTYKTSDLQIRSTTRALASLKKKMHFSYKTVQRPAGIKLIPPSTEFKILHDFLKNAIYKFSMERPIL